MKKYYSNELQKSNKNFASIFQIFILSLVLLFSMNLKAQTHVAMQMVFVGSTATTADFDVVLTNDGTTTLNFNAIVMRANNAAISSITTAGSVVTAIALNNCAVPAWTIGGVIWPNILINMPYNMAGTTFKLNQSTNNTFFATIADRPSLPFGVPVNIGRFRFVVTGGTWIPNSQLGFIWNTGAGLVANVNGATLLTNINTAVLRTLTESANQPLNPSSVSGVMAGNGVICTAGGSSNINVTVTGGVGPYQLVYTNGTTNDTIFGYTSGSPISVSPTVATTYSIVSIDNSTVGNSGSATITVGATPPVPNISNLAAVNEQCNVNSITPPNATSTCFGVIAGVPNVTFPITAQGTTTIIWTYNDGNGNIVTQTQLVNIADNVAPVPDNASLTAVTSTCSVSTITAPTAIDNCAGPIAGTTTTTFPITTQGTTTVIWSYSDGNGNVTAQNQLVTITDNIAPVANLAALPNVTGVCAVASITAPTATDNCSGTITGTTPTAFPITTQGTTSVTWTYNDGNGNITTQTQQVIITDNIAPVPNVTSLPAIIAQCSVTSLTAPTAVDNCVGTITGTTTVTLPINVQGTTTVTWTYNDGNGNITTQTQQVIITDNIAPVPNISALPSVTAQCQVTTLTVPTALDNCSGTLNGVPNVSLPITAQGTTTVTWTYTDGQGNITTQTQQVIITDNIAPVPNAAILPSLFGNCSATLTPPTATDACVGLVTATANVPSPITTAGLTVVTWTYIDGNGNTTTQNQNVTISAPNASVTQLGATLTAVSLTATYQWLDCNNGFAIIPGATNQSYTPTALVGNYALKATEFNCSDTSNCFLVDFTGLEESLNGIEIQIYPNPNNGQFTVELIGLNAENLEMRILDITGRLVLTEKIENKTGKIVQKVDVSQNENGVYIVNLVGDNGLISTKRIVKN